MEKNNKKKGKVDTTSIHAEEFVSIKSRDKDKKEKVILRKRG